jgi:hypothetical protein
MQALPIPALIAVSGLLAVGAIYFVWARKIESKPEHKVEQK